MRTGEGASEYRERVTSEDRERLAVFFRQNNIIFVMHMACLHWTPGYLCASYLLCQ